MKTIKIEDLIKVNPNRQPTSPNIGQIFRVTEVPLGKHAVVELIEDITKDKGQAGKEWVLDNMMKVGERHAKE